MSTSCDDIIIYSDLKRVKSAAMNGYYLVLTTIDLFVLSFMGLLTRLSESLNKKQKRGFFLAFALIAGISAMDMVTLAVLGVDTKALMYQVSGGGHLSGVCAG